MRLLSSLKMTSLLTFYPHLFMCHLKLSIREFIWGKNNNINITRTFSKTYNALYYRLMVKLFLYDIFLCECSVFLEELHFFSAYTKHVLELSHVIRYRASAPFGLFILYYHIISYLFNCRKQIFSYVHTQEFYKKAIVLNGKKFIIILYAYKHFRFNNNNIMILICEKDKEGLCVVMLCYPFWFW